MICSTNVTDSVLSFQLRTGVRVASFVPYHALFPMDRGNIEKKKLSHFYVHLSVILTTRGGRVWQTPRVDTPSPRQTAAPADGTHPTGMHSCSNLGKVLGCKYLGGTLEQCFLIIV